MTHSLIFAICSSAPIIFYHGNGDCSIWYDLLFLLLFCMFVNKKQLAVLPVNCFASGKYRDVTKISSCRVKLSRWGIRQLGISLGYIFLLFPCESIRGKILARRLLMTALGGVIFCSQNILVLTTPCPPCFICKCSFPFPPPLCTFLHTWI